MPFDHRYFYLNLDPSSGWYPLVKEARAAGMASVRVDTHAGNVPMQRLLVSLGFRHCCDVTISNDLEPTKLRLGYELVL